MIPFFSRRNQVYPVLWQGRAAVEKHFPFPEDWERESALYTALENRLPLPEVLERRPGCLTLALCPATTLLAVLEAQESSGFDPAPWLALAAWLRRCGELCGQLPPDGNLRNFLWDGRQVLGLDLEGFQAVPLQACGAASAAALLAYAPAGTPVKRAAAALLAAELEVPDRAVDAAAALFVRRRDREIRALSGIILAGGASRRMGRDKARLTLGGRTLLQWQADKLRSLGITDILISGGEHLALPGIRTVPDVLPHRGPLGGLHACLSQARNDRCAVLSVDTPLLPVNALAQLCRSPREDGTLLRYGGRPEPLIGVYDRGLSSKIYPLIQDGGAPVRSLQTVGKWGFFDYLGPAEYLQNCNTPESFRMAESLLKTYTEKNVPLCF